MSEKGWDLGAYLREQREHARLSVRQLANLAGVSNPYLSQVERGLRRPSAEVLQQIARGLRISAEVLYVRAGILDSEGRPDVETAINADPDLNDRQRRVLLDIYASFRAENRRAAAPEEPEPAPRRRPAARVRSVARTARSATRPARLAGRSTSRGAAAGAGAAAAPSGPGSVPKSVDAAPAPTLGEVAAPTPGEVAAPTPGEVAAAQEASSGTAAAGRSAGPAPRKRATARASKRAARSTQTALGAVAAGNGATPPEPGGGAPDAHQ